MNTNQHHRRDLVAVLTTVSAHLAAYPVAVPVTVTVDTLGEQITALLDTASAADTAAGLLSWADTLTTVTGQVWRVPHGHSVHLSITGETATGITVRVYSGIAHDAYTASGIGPDLAAGERAPVSLAVLRTAATLAVVTP